MIGSYILGVLISTGIGLILGLEREYDKLKQEQLVAGIRTFPIMTIIGFSVGRLREYFSPWIPIMGLGAFILITGIYQLSMAQTEGSNDQPEKIGNFRRLPVGNYR